MSQNRITKPEYTWSWRGGKNDLQLGFQNVFVVSHSGGDGGNDSLTGSRQGSIWRSPWGTGWGQGLPGKCLQAKVIQSG